VLEDQLRKAEAGKEVDKRNTESEKHEGEKCLVLGDSIVRHVGREHKKYDDHKLSYTVCMQQLYI
jgi:hypothetical protein